MDTFHLVPRGDAINHKTRGDGCACVVDVQMRNGDRWVHHRTISLEEAVMRPSVPEEVA